MQFGLLLMLPAKRTGIMPPSRNADEFSEKALPIDGRSLPIVAQPPRPRASIEAAIAGTTNFDLNKIDSSRKCAARADYGKARICFI
jgi:hypothetical protein